MQLLVVTTMFLRGALYPGKMMATTTNALPRGSVMRDAARVQEALQELVRILQFRDRDRACCYELSVSQCHGLQALVQAGPMTVTDLGSHLYLEKSTASRLAKSLLEKGLIRRRAPRGDGRVVILQVTEAGQRLTRRILNDLAEEYMDLLEQLTPEVRTALPAVLDRLARVIAGRTDGTGFTCC